MATCGTLNIESDFDGGNGDGGDGFDPSAVEVAGCSDVPDSLEPGQQSVVGVIVDNGNDQSAEADLVVRADGQEIGRFTADVQARGSQFGVLVTAPDSPAEYSLEASVEGDPQPASAFGRTQRSARQFSVLCGGTLDPTTVEEGETFKITVQSENDGLLGDEFRYNVFAMPDGHFLGTIDQGWLEAGESTLTTHHLPADIPPGEYDIEVQDAVGPEVDVTGVCGTLTVEQASDGGGDDGGGGGGDIVNVLCGGTLTPTTVPCSGAPVDVDVTLQVENTSSNAIDLTLTPTIDGLEFPEEDISLVLTAGEDRQTTQTIQLPAPANEPLLPCGGSAEIGVEVTSVQVIGGLTPQLLASQADRGTLAAAAVGAGTGLVAALLSRR